MPRSGIGLNELLCATVCQAKQRCKTGFISEIDREPMNAERSEDGERRARTTDAMSAATLGRQTFWVPAAQPVLTEAGFAGIAANVGRLTSCNNHDTAQQMSGRA